jgi:hypothetical protein
LLFHRNLLALCFKSSVSMAGDSMDGKEWLFLTSRRRLQYRLQGWVIGGFSSPLGVSIRLDVRRAWTASFGGLIA